MPEKRFLFSGHFFDAFFNSRRYHFWGDKLSEGADLRKYFIAKRIVELQRDDEMSHHHGLAQVYFKIVKT